MIISNTHDYIESGKKVNIEDISHLIDSMCVTTREETAEIHDKFNRCKGYYEHGINNLKKYVQLKKGKQEICIIFNLTSVYKLKIIQIWI